jgi:hypothetical protein
MIKNQGNMLFAIMTLVIILTGYGLNSQLEEVPYATELSSETDSTFGGIQSDCDSDEDENPNHVSQLICNIETVATCFTLIHPSLVKFHAFAVWQPPKNC